MLVLLWGLGPVGARAFFPLEGKPGRSSSHITECKIGKIFKIFPEYSRNHGEII
jgi:hypothetical protein